MSTLDSLRRQLLDAREARAAAIARLSGALPAGHALVFLSLNVPGPDKNSPRLEALFGRTQTALLAPSNASGMASLFAPPFDCAQGVVSASRTTRGHGGPSSAARDAMPLAERSRGHEEGRDALGPWVAIFVPGDAPEIKRQCIALEERLPAGRLIDLDLYDRLGRQVDRASLGLPPRRCLVCGEPAVDCMRTERHTRVELAETVARLLHRHDVARLAEALVEGARVELELTPKPGLVDRRDNGSHPDLSFHLMERSIALLPEYYEELVLLLNPAEAGFHISTLHACVEAGRRAEERMLASIGTNAHRGYIFLSGLVLLAGGSRTAICEIATAIIAGQRTTGVAQGHGEAARRRHAVGGILGEAMKGLPSVFDHGMPALERAEARFGDTDAARHAAMATLMTLVEDTTTLHRCGAEGLARLRRDGQRILGAIEGGGNYVRLLEQLNEEYRAAGMTMGGVADLLAITIALHRGGA